MTYYGKPPVSERIESFTKMYDVDGRVILKLRVICPEQGIIENICEKYVDFVEKYLLPEMIKDYEDSEMERKHLRYPCRLIGISVIRNESEKRFVDRMEIIHEHDNVTEKICPLIIKYK